MFKRRAHYLNQFFVEAWIVFEYNFTMYVSCINYYADDTELYISIKSRLTNIDFLLYE